MKQILTILIATILLFSSCEDKPIVYHDYEITYGDNSKDTLYQVLSYYDTFNPHYNSI
jgi:hypothetical protein